MLVEVMKKSIPAVWEGAIDTTDVMGRKMEDEKEGAHRYPLLHEGQSQPSPLFCSRLSNVRCRARGMANVFAIGATTCTVNLSFISASPAD
jgi:hypothetical protein